MVTPLAHLKKAIATFTSQAAEKLRRHRLAAGVMQVFVSSSQFTEASYNDSLIVTLPIATNDTAELLHYALLCAERLFQEDCRFIKAGVLMLNLTPEGQRQPNVTAAVNGNFLINSFITDRFSYANFSSMTS